MMADKPKPPPCETCGHPIDLHLPAGGHSLQIPGGCYMLVRPQPDILRVEPCKCVRTPDTFLAVAR